MQNKLQYRYYLLAIIPPFMGAVSNVVSKYVVGDISPIALLFYRWVVGVLILTPFIIKSFVAEFDNIRASKGIIFIGALSGITLFNLFVYYAMHYTSSTNTAIIISIFPIFVLLFGVFFKKERLQRTQVFSIILSFVGALIIVSHGNVLDEITDLFSNVGDFLAFIAAITYAIYTFPVKLKPSSVSSYSFLYATMLLGTIMIFPIYLLDVFILENTFEPNAQNILPILMLGLGVSVIGMTIFNLTILRIGANLSSIIFYLMPLFTAIMGVTILGEEFEIFHVIGMSLILFGVNLPIMYKVFAKKRVLKASEGIEMKN